MAGDITPEMMHRMMSMNGAILIDKPVEPAVERRIQDLVSIALGRFIEEFAASMDERSIEAIDFEAGKWAMLFDSDFRPLLTAHLKPSMDEFFGPPKFIVPDGFVPNLDDRSAIIGNPEHVTFEPICVLKRRQ